MRLRLVSALILNFFITLSLLASESHLHVLRGVDDAGRATQTWQEMIAKRLTPAQFHDVESLAKPYTPAESAWVRLVESRQPVWDNELSRLAVPFSPVTAPDASIVLGNRGGEDAFTHDPHTIGFDVERLNTLYGSADLDTNSALIDHLFHHEYTHLLQKAWVRDHPLLTETPLHAALADMWLEGMGNYYSLSDAWEPADGKPSTKATQALNVLIPRLVTRLAALACASSENASQLSKNISSGHFDQKWGALPVALWLQAESNDPTHLRDFILAGEEGVWTLASRHVTPDVKAQLDEIRTLEKACSTAK